MTPPRPDSTHVVEAGPVEKRLLRYLFDPHRDDAHNILERPSYNDSLPLPVYLIIYLTQIIDVDEKNQILQTCVWLDLHWFDYHFRWDPTDFNNITSIIVPASRVWRPDILLYNSADERFDATFPANVIVDHSGSLHNVPPGMFKSTCNISIKWYPFDTQTCSMKFGSWTYEGNLIDLLFYCDNQTACNQTFGRGNADDVMENGEWDVLSFSAERHVNTYTCCPEKYIDITYYLEIKRRTLYYTFNLIVPCIIISTMALLGFLIPPDAGEKISLGVTILLSLTVFLMMVAEKMPPTSAAIPLIGMYFTCVMIVCSLSLVFTVLVLNFHHRSTDAIELPSTLRLVFNVWLARLLLMRPRNAVSAVSSPSGSGDSSPTTGGAGTGGGGGGSSSGGCMGGQQRYNRAFHSGSVKGSRSLLANVLDMESEIWARATAAAAPPPPLLPGPIPPGPKPASTPGLEDNGIAGMGQLREILAHLRRVTRKLADTEEQERRAQDWRFAARVMDRCCLLIFSVIIIISATSILVQDVINVRPKNDAGK